MCDTKLKKDVNGEYLCICNYCTTILLDENPNHTSNKYDVSDVNCEEMKRYDGEDEELIGAWVCPVCNTDAYLMDL